MESPTSGFQIFDLERIQKTIQFLLTKNALKNDNSKSISSSRSLFDELLEEIETFHHRKVTNLTELKTRENKKLKGDIWERFCWLYLTNLPLYTKSQQGNTQRKYSAVWLWNDVPQNVKEYLKLHLSKMDNGIDIIAQVNLPNTRTYHAIQCKYLSNLDKSVSWKVLSTFVGLCARSGPWDRQIVMTTGRGIAHSRQLPRGENEYNICQGTFRAISREMWMRMAGVYFEHRVTDLEANIPGPVSGPDTISETPAVPVVISTSSAVGPERSSVIRQEPYILRGFPTHLLSNSVILAAAAPSPSPLPAPSPGQTGRQPSGQPRKPRNLDDLRQRRLQYYEQKNPNNQIPEK